MAVTAKEIKDCFGEFSGLSDALVDKWRLQAERRINLVQWGEKADDAILWLTPQEAEMRLTYETERAVLRQVFRRSG